MNDYLYTVLRNQDVRIEYRMCDPEPDVGLPTRYVDDWRILDAASGLPVPWEPTADEQTEFLAEIFRTHA